MLAAVASSLPSLPSVAASTITQIGANGTATNPNGGIAIAAGNSGLDTTITAIGGAGYVSTSSGSNGGYGGYAGASASYNSFNAGPYGYEPIVSATGGAGGSNYLGKGYGGGNAGSTVTLTENNSLSANAGSSAQGGSGGTSQNGNGGNAGTAESSISVTGNENITATTPRLAVPPVPPATPPPWL